MNASSVPRIFVFGFEGLTPPDEVRRWLEAGLGGVILFRRNLRDLEQICRLTGALHASASAPLLVGVDQEGGRVVRLPAPFLPLPAAATLGRVEDVGLVQRLAETVGRELRAAGITWNLAPVLNVHTNPSNSVIGDRAFSDNPERVARLGLSVIQGLTDAGVLSSAKHFPGHGETAADSHLTLPESPQTRARWETVEFLPFRRAIRAGAPSILVAHLLCPALDPRQPSSLSRTILTDILRGELGFEGVVVSDDMEMDAIAARFDVGEAAVRFFQAGGDLCLICHRQDRQQAALRAVEDALRTGRLSRDQIEASLQRIARLHRRLPAPLAAAGVPAAAVSVGDVSHRRLLDTVLMAADAGPGGGGPLHG